MFNVRLLVGCFILGVAMWYMESYQNYKSNWNCTTRYRSVNWTGKSDFYCVRVYMFVSTFIYLTHFAAIFFFVVQLYSCRKIHLLRFLSFFHCFYQIFRNKGKKELHTHAHRFTETQAKNKIRPFTTKSFSITLKSIHVYMYGLDKEIKHISRK